MRIVNTHDFKINWITDEQAKYRQIEKHLVRIESLVLPNKQNKTRLWNRPTESILTFNGFD